MNDHGDPNQDAAPEFSVEKTTRYRYDFFLAHAGADQAAADTLFKLLSPRFRVFLDNHSLKLGDDWALEISRAQRRSQITVVLISSRTEAAYYQREEIAAAINMARRERHRVVPLYLDGWPTDESDMPYGLRLKHGLSVPEVGGLQQVARKLEVLSAQLEAEETPKTSPGLLGNGETASNLTETGHHESKGWGGSGPDSLERAKLDRAGEPKPSIQIGGGVVGQNLVIGGTQSVNRDLRITVGSVAAAPKTVHEELLDQVEQLSQVLATVPANQTNYAQEVKLAVEDAIGEVAKKPLDKKRLKVRAENLKRAADALASTNPTVLQLASQIASTLSKIG